MTTDDFIVAVLRNPVCDALLDEVARLDLPDAWIVAGCLTQTVWNIRTNRVLDYGINDYDVFYFDPDTSWDAEDRIITSLKPVALLLDAHIEVRNQARVHLWYGNRHGVPYPALMRSTDAIDRFLTRCTQIGLQRTPRGDRLYAPHGFLECSQLIVRPNITANFSADAYLAKARRWVTLWPELRVEPPS